MPATVRSEFALALNQVATERGIDPAVVLDTIKAAILAAYRKDYGSEDLEKLEIEINPDSGEAKVFKDGKDVTPPGFGRIAAQTAKQVILQRIREAEKKAIITDYTTKVGSIVNGMVLRFDGPTIIVDIGRAEGIMPPSEQIPNERYKLNQRLSFYIEGIRQTVKGEEIVVSRAHKNFIAALFAREVPEVANKSVTIREIAREAGNRTKIAVSSNTSGVDPVGSCVGQKGVRVQAVINELGGIEKIDIIQFNDEPVNFIQAALAPAKDISIELNEKKQSAIAYVPDDQLSLAIGRDGQNVRLAAKLSGWKIDIKPKSGIKKQEVIHKESETNNKKESKPKETETKTVDESKPKDKSIKTANESKPKKESAKKDSAGKKKSKLDKQEKENLKEGK